MRADIEVFVYFLLTFPFFARSLDLGPACQNMWKNAGNNLIVPTELNVDAVANTKQLFKVLPGKGAVKVRSAVFQRFRDLMVDYQAAYPAPTQQHIDDFITAVTQLSGPMEAAFDYLKQQGSLPPSVTTLQQFKGVLNDLWFQNSNGFKHVFVGDLNANANTFTGFHNWYQFLLEQERNPTQTTNIAFNHPQPFVNKRLPYFLRGLTFRWRGANKAPQGSTSSMFVGTSPAFDLAMFTTCVLSGRAAGGGTIDCVCKVKGLGLGESTVEFTTVEDPLNKKVVTAHPRNVK